MLDADQCTRSAVRHTVRSHDRRIERLHDRQPGDDLARRFTAGEPDALRDVVAAYGGPMMTAALHVIGGDRRLAEEVVQQSLLKAWRAAGSFDPSRPLAPWLYSIVRRCAIDVWRHERRHHHAGDLVEDVAIVADKSEAVATAWTVRAALDALPDDERTLLRLMYFDGLTQAEIADRLAIPLGTVKSRMSPRPPPPAPAPSLSAAAPS